MEALCLQYFWYLCLKLLYTVNKCMCKTTLAASGKNVASGTTGQETVKRHSTSRTVALKLKQIKIHCSIDHQK